MSSNETTINWTDIDTILLDMDAGRALRKAIAVSKDYRKGVADRLEAENVKFNRKVRRGFLAIAKAEPRRGKVVKVRENVEDTQKSVITEVEKVLRKRK